MPVHFPETDTEPPVRDPHDLEDSDSDMIFDFEMEDRTKMPTTTSQDVEAGSASASHQTDENSAPAQGNNEASGTGSSVDPSVSSPVDLNASSTSESLANTGSDQEDESLATDSDTDDEVPGPSNSALDASAKSFLAKPSECQPAQQPFWSQNNTSQSGPSNTSGRPSYPGSSSRAASYNPLAPHPHQVHQGHHYVTGRCYGSPGWKPPGTQRSSDATRRNHRSHWRQGQQQQQQQQQPQAVHHQPQAFHHQQQAFYHHHQQQQQRQAAHHQPQPVYQHYSRVVPQSSTVYQNGHLHQHAAFTGGQFQPKTPSPLSPEWSLFYPPGYVSAHYAAHHQLPPLPSQRQPSGYQNHPHGQSTVQASGSGNSAVLQASASHSQVEVTKDSSPEPAMPPSRCVIVNGSKHNYDVDMLNRRAWGDLSGSKSKLPTTGASLPSLVSDKGTVTDKGSMTGSSSDSEPDLTTSAASDTAESSAPLPLSRHSSPLSENGTVSDEDASPSANASSCGSAGDASFVVPPHPRSYNKITSQTEKAPAQATSSDTNRAFRGRSPHPPIEVSHKRRTATSEVKQPGVAFASTGLYAPLRLPNSFTADFYDVPRKKKFKGPH
ncbi:hypothetical protein F503_03623 [Ophiostoma piceae UAMH 11346]|uniref:Uncharacterized protein n=1 Tax=Ophiostoma piceae (strain UAMH 11346) TaxID=1262450 RepID=S3BYK1_OPHP1|nr:hypothetical protein F503_03623 [Ophiostoma piceae UAMH 11346]